MERLEKDEFLAVERAIGGTLSDAAPALLIYRAAGNEYGTSISLTQSSQHEFHLAVVSLRGEPVPAHKVIKLPPDIAERLLSVMKLCLTKQLYAPTGKAYRYPIDRPEGGTYWVNLRIDKSTSIAGVVLTERDMTGKDSFFPFLELIDQISQLAVSDRATGDAVREIDISIAALRALYPPGP